MSEYFGFLLLVILSGGAVAGIIVLKQLVGPRRSSPVHDMPFETGMEPRKIMRGRFSIKFFIVALLFILFDIELIFLFPWALVYRELGWFAFAEMFVFLLVVVAGLFYSVKKGALEWN